MDLKNNDGNTPLHIAADVNEIEVAKCLIEHGAQIDMKNKDGETPFDLADHELATYFLEKKREGLNQKPANIINDKALCIIWS